MHWKDSAILLLWLLLFLLPYFILFHFPGFPLRSPNESADDDCVSECACLLVCTQTHEWMKEWTMYWSTEHLQFLEWCFITLCFVLILERHTHWLMVDYSISRDYLLPTTTANVESTNQAIPRCKLFYLHLLIICWNICYHFGIYSEDPLLKILLNSHYCNQPFLKPISHGVLSPLLLCIFELVSS